MDKKKYLPILLFLFCVAGSQAVRAQLTVSGQIRTRTEVRNGQGNPHVTDTSRAVFTSQRSRLNIGYAGYRFKIYTSLQDVRVWGQDASSINRVTDVNDGLMLHEAWAEISLVDTGKVVKNFTLKIGRQELVYDDVRLLGNLDWLQQARRHDAMLLKFDHNGWTAHLGAAYNQNAVERKSGSIYNGTPVTGPVSTNGQTANYKSMQFLYVARKHYFGNSSFLFFKDDFSKFHFAPSDVDHKTPIYEKGVWSRYTVGGNMFGTAKRKIGFALSAFYQFGQYREGTKLNEYLLSASAMYSAGRKWSFGPGADLTSGTNDPKKKYQRFDPLYGTPHKFWGYMDYFYVADGFGSSGLADYYFKTKCKAKDNLTLTLDAHQFMLPAAVTKADGTAMSKKLGSEFDFVLVFNMTKAITLEGGYSTMFATETLSSAKVKNIKNAASFNDWGYVMINIKPSEFIVK